MSQHKIIKSTANKADISNIADLAYAVIRKTEFKPTVQMYMRLAFLVSLSFVQQRDRMSY